MLSISDSLAVKTSGHQLASTILSGLYGKEFDSLEIFYMENRNHRGELVF